MDQPKTLSATTADLTGRTVLITGANVGLGKDAARQFLSMNPQKVIMTTRDLTIGQEAAREIIEATNETRKDVVEVWELDLANFESTVTFARRANKELDRLDIVILNAAILTNTWTVTEDGYETSLQVNVISTGLLAVLLLPLLQKTLKLAPFVTIPDFRPHLVIVSSRRHHHAKFVVHTSQKPISALNDESNFDPTGTARYDITKLLDIFLARATHALPAADGVVVLNADPGLCISELFREASPSLRAYVEQYGRTVEVGAYNYTAAALRDYQSAVYIGSCEIQEVSEFADSPDGLDCQRRVWEELKVIWAAVAPETKTIM